MNQKEKAFQIFTKFLRIGLTKREAKEASLIAVQEVINANPHGNPLNSTAESEMDFWVGVKKEVKLLV